MNKITYHYARHYTDYEEGFENLDEALYRVWSNHEFGTAYGKDIILNKTGEVLLDHDAMLRLATMLYCDDYDE